MDPQTFVRLSVGQLGLKLPGANASKAARACHCEVRLRGFPVQTAPVPLIHSPEFSLDESDLKALPTPGCFRAPQPYLEVAVYLGRRGGHCGVIAGMKRLVGVVRVDVGPEWRDVLLRHGWTGVGRGEARPELHLRVKLEADPRYVFQFEDEVVLNPQVVQLHGAVRQPIFSCKFIRDRRPSQTDSLGGQYYSSSSGEEKEMEGAEGLEGGDPRPVMAAAFVPATGCDRVSRSNPGAWLIVRADTTGSSESWQPWGRLEAWREGATPSRDAVRLRLRARVGDAAQLREGRGVRHRHGQARGEPWGVRGRRVRDELQGAGGGRSCSSPRATSRAWRTPPCSSRSRPPSTSASRRAGRSEGRRRPTSQARRRPIPSS